MSFFSLCLLNSAYKILLEINLHLFVHIGTITSTFSIIIYTHKLMIIIIYQQKPKWAIDALATIKDNFVPFQYLSLKIKNQFY